jgi:hypothetical protein
MDQPTFYQIRVNGHLDDAWVDWFEGLTILNQHDGDAILSGSLPDQTALHAILTRIYNLGLTLISVNRLPEQDQQ